MFESLISLQYCYDYLINQISIGLLLYAHIPTALIAIFFGVFLLYKTRTLASVTLFIVCISFAIWSLLSIGSWFAFLGAERMMFMWGLIDMFALVFFFFSYYFIYFFTTEKDLPIWQKIVGIFLLLPTIYWTFWGANLTIYDAGICEAWEDELVALYPYIIQGVFLMATIFLVISQYIKKKSKQEKRKVLLAGTGVVVFLSFFFLATLSVNLMVNYGSNLAVQYAYNFEIYGLFGMPVLLGFLVFMIVKYRSFDIKLVGAQALIISLVILLGSKFLFLQDNVSRVLTTVSLVVTGGIGINLIRSVKKEVKQREQIERLAKDLEKSNAQQVDLIHFITHQVKGFFTKSRFIFSGFLEGDYGKLTPEMKSMIEEGFRSDTEAVGMVENILKASNLRNGTVTYDKKEFDFKKLVEEVTEKQKPVAEAKSLSLNLNIEKEDYKFVGDKKHLEHVVHNLIDNAVKYTPKGEVKVSLIKSDGKIRFSVKDSGVGITPEDMQKLFTEGGRGKDSVKINTDSTGYGLYIVKGIVEAHGGKVWAESEGQGKGSTFIVELPA